MSVPILYSFRRCPYAMRARIVLRQCNIQCELREVVLREKPESMLTASPKGTVPVLILKDGTVIDESLDIMKWALEQHPGFDETRLIKGWRAKTERLIESNDGEFKHHLDRYKYPNRYGDVDSLHHREQAESFLLELTEYLSESEWLMGETPSLCDAAIGPFVRQFAKCGAGLVRPVRIRSCTTLAESIFELGWLYISHEEIPAMGSWHRRGLFSLERKIPRQAPRQAGRKWGCALH